MALELQEQLKNSLDKSNNILITFKSAYNGDALGSALALKKHLEDPSFASSFAEATADKKATAGQRKTVDIACDNFELFEKYKFLHENNCVNKCIDGLNQCVITCDLSSTKLKDFSYTVEDNKLKIYLTPQSGQLSDQHLETKTSGFKYDLIIVLDTEEIYTENQDFFVKTTIINIDHKTSNENYGQINLIDPNYASVSEIIYHYLLKDHNINAETAQCLLCGLIEKTQSFKTKNVNSQTLELAGKLMMRGANREEIIKNLFYNKSVNQLKLWGKILLRLKEDDKYPVAWSYVEEGDFVETKTSPELINGVINELISSSDKYQVVVIFYQHQAHLHAILFCHHPHNALHLSSSHQPSGNKSLVTFSLGAKSIQEGSRIVLDEIFAKIH